MADRIALVTYAGLPHLADDDRLLLGPLERHGFHAEPAVWNGADVAWASYDAVVVRSCWDYHLRPREFLSWVGRLEAMGVPLWNPPAVLRWNADKAYLRELEAAGIPVVPTRWIGPDTDVALADLLEQTGWDEAVVKPTISASAHETWRTSRSRAEKDDARFRFLAARHLLMLQPFLPEVAADGEWSLVYLGGSFSHAVLKRPCPDDFRVQLEHGGTAIPAEPDAALIEAGRAALREIPGEWLYARVDGCVIAGRFRIMEVEMLEPSLFLATAPAAPDRFMEALERVVFPGTRQARSQRKA